MLPIVRWTIWQRRWSTFWWSFGMFAFIFITMVFYPTFKNQADQLAKSFDSLPKAAVQLFGGSTDFFSPVGYLNSQIFFLMLPLLLSLLAVAVALAMVGREEQDMTIEMLLARPVSRARLLAGKGLAGAIIVAVVSVVSLVTIVIASHLFRVDLSASSIALATVNCFLLALCTGALVFLIAAMGRARVAGMGIGALIGVGGYLIVSLAGTVHWLKGPSKIFPFNYYQSEAILRGTYHWPSALFFAAVIIACGGLSYLVFRRRDIG